MVKTSVGVRNRLRFASIRYSDAHSTKLTRFKLGYLQMTPAAFLIYAIASFCANMRLCGGARLPPEWYNSIP
jgi:hypothetical protein